MTLDSEKVNTLKESQIMSRDDLKLTLTTQGVLQLIKISTSKILWQSEAIKTTHQGPYQMILQKDSNLVIYDGNKQAIWATSTNDTNLTPNSGPFYLTVLKENCTEYNHSWGLVLINGRGMMKWGRFGPRMVWDKIPLIPGSFLDSKGCQNKTCSLRVGEYISNGRDTLRLDDYGNLVFSTNRNKPIITPPTTLKLQRSTGYIAVWEEGGTIVVYNPVDYPSHAYLYRRKIGNGRYLHLPTFAHLPIEGTPNEYAIVVRGENGTVQGGLFNNPKNPLTTLQKQVKKNYIHEHWDGNTVNSRYLMLEVWPTANATNIEEKFFLYFHLRKAVGYGYPEVVWTISKTIDVNIPGVHQIKLVNENMWQDNRFNVNFQITYPYLDTSYTTDIELYKSPLSSDSDDNSNYLLLSNIVPEMIHIDCSYDFDHDETCRYIWGTEITKF